MVVVLLALALTGQAVEEVWHVKCPYGHAINVRGHRDGQWFRAAFPVDKRMPPAPTINFGVDMPRTPKAPEVRGTDPELGRELAGKLIEQRPCPGPGPCPPQPPRPPKPPRLPDPLPETPEPNWLLLGVAGAFVLLALFLGLIFLVLLVAGRNRQ